MDNHRLGAMFYPALNIGNCRRKHLEFDGFVWLFGKK